jgi:hypothetical protein
LQKYGLHDIFYLSIRGMPPDKRKQDRAIATDQMFESSLVAEKGSINQGAIALLMIIDITPLVIRERIFL